MHLVHVTDKTCSLNHLNLWITKCSLWSCGCLWRAAPRYWPEGLDCTQLTQKKDIQSTVCTECALPLRYLSIWNQSQWMIICKVPSIFSSFFTIRWHTLLLRKQWFRAWEDGSVSELLALHTQSTFWCHTLTGNRKANVVYLILALGRQKHDRLTTKPA